jgi:ankyrin repeat protein
MSSQINTDRILKLIQPYEYSLTETLEEHSNYRQMKNPLFSGFRLPYISTQHDDVNNRFGIARRFVKTMYDELIKDKYIYETIELIWYNGQNIDRTINKGVKGPSINLSHKFHNAILFLLYTACTFNNKEMVSYIISLPNFPINNAKNNLRRSILHHAIIENKKEIVEILLKEPRINVNKVISSKYYNGTPLMLANEKPEIFKLLIEHPLIDLNKVFRHTCYISVDDGEKDRERITILHYAILSDNRELVKALLNSLTIDVNKKSDKEDGRSPLYYAVSKGNIEIVKLLLNHKNIDVNKGRGGITPLIHAVNLSHFDIVKLLINMPSINIHSSVEALELYSYNYIEVDFSNIEIGSSYAWNKPRERWIEKRWPFLYNTYLVEKINIFDILTYENKTKLSLFDDYFYDIKHELEDAERQQQRIERRGDLDVDIIGLRENFHRERDEKTNNVMKRAEKEYEKYIHDRDEVFKIITDRFGGAVSDKIEEEPNVKLEDSLFMEYHRIDKLIEKGYKIPEILEEPEIKIPQKSRVKENRCKNKEFIKECKEGTSLSVSKYNCNINYIGKFRSTPLIDSINEGNLRVTSILLSNPKIKVNLKDSYGRNALDYLIILDNDGRVYGNNMNHRIHAELTDLNDKNYILHGPLKYLPIVLASATIDEIKDAYYKSSIERTKKLIHDILRDRVSRAITEIDLFSNLPQLPGDVYKYIIAKAMVPETKWWPKFSRHREPQIAIKINHEVHDKKPGHWMLALLEKFVDDKNVLEQYDEPPHNIAPRIVRRRRVIQMPEDI